MNTKPATIKLNGNVVSKNVHVQIHDQSRSGLPDWGGDMALPDGEELQLGVKYRLEVGDGRCGDFLVKEQTPGKVTKIKFEAAGELKKC
jgi:hypothetical protein